MSDAHSTRGALKLHTFLGGGSARVKLAWIVLCIAGPLPWVIAHFVQVGHARDLGVPLLFLAGLCVACFVHLRRRPKIYASTHGLDLEWAWGTKRYVPWDNVRDVQEIRSLGLGQAAFRLGLGDGSIILCARRDFAELIEHLKLTQPTQ